jgi:type 1 fimbria pilin
MKFPYKILAASMALSIASAAQAANTTVQMQLSGSIVDSSCTFSETPTITVAFGEIEANVALTTVQGSVDISCSKDLNFDLSTTKTTDLIISGSTAVKVHLCLQEDAAIVGDCSTGHGQHFAAGNDIATSGSGLARTYHYAVTIDNPGQETVADLANTSWDITITPN